MAGAWESPTPFRAHPQSAAGPGWPRLLLLLPLWVIPRDRAGIPGLREGSRHGDPWVALAWGAGVMCTAGDAQNSITLLIPPEITSIPLSPGAETPGAGTTLGLSAPWWDSSARCWVPGLEGERALLKGWGGAVGVVQCFPAPPS